MIPQGKPGSGLQMKAFHPRLRIVPGASDTTHAKALPHGLAAGGEKLPRCMRHQGQPDAGMPDTVFPPLVPPGLQEIFEIPDAPPGLECIACPGGMGASEPEGRRKGLPPVKRTTQYDRRRPQGAPCRDAEEDPLVELPSRDLGENCGHIPPPGFLKKKRGHCAPCRTSLGTHEAIFSLCPCFRGRLSLSC